MGASLGNSAIWVNTKGTGAIERIFNARCGECLFGAVSVRYGLASQQIEKDHALEQLEAQEAPSIALHPDGPGSVELHPAYQRRRFSIAGTIHVSETTFVPLQATCLAQGDPPVAYVRVELKNAGTATHSLRITGFARLRGTLNADVQARYDASIAALVVSNPSRPNATRCFGVWPADAAKYVTTADFGRVYDRRHLRPLVNDTRAEGDVLGALQRDIVLSAGDSTTLCFLCGAFGDPSLRPSLHTRGCRTPTKRSKRPSSISGISCGSAKYSRRTGPLTKARFGEGQYAPRYGALQGRPGFTNEPGVSSNVVSRDAAWFVDGNDHFLPAFRVRARKTRSGPISKRQDTGIL